MKFDLKKMSRKELEKLRGDVDKAIDRIRTQDLKKVRSEMEKLAAAHGVSMADIMEGKAAPKKTTPKVKSAPKYANPSDTSQTWTGKGRQPDWFKTAIAAGRPPESMAI